MAKRRKTREQKKLADSRHSFTHLIVSQQLSETKISLQKNIENVSVRRVENLSASDSYPFLIKDLSKTTLLTGIIIALQFIVFFAIRNHILTIPGLSY